MLADTDAELFSMAATIGLKRKWCQPSPITHYYLARKQRDKAINYGAREVDLKFWLDRIKEKS